MTQKAGNSNRWKFQRRIRVDHKVVCTCHLCSSCKLLLKR